MREREESTMYLSQQQFYHRSQHYIFKNCEEKFDFKGRFGNTQNLKITITLSGEHQSQNAAVAMMGIEVLRQY